MLYIAKLENLDQEYPEARADASPTRRPYLVQAGGMLSGAAIEFPLKGRQNQQTVWVYRPISDGRKSIYVGAYFRFPIGFDWTTPNGIPNWGNEHKLIIVNCTDGIGRVLVNLRGTGKSPTIAIHLERLNYQYMDSENQHSYGQGIGVSNFSETRWPQDGTWHFLEVEVERTGGLDDRVRLWLDSKVIMDVRGVTCGKWPSSIDGYAVGAYYNGAPANDTRFWVTGIRDDGLRTVPVPVITGEDAREELAKRLEGIVEDTKTKLLDLANRIRSIQIR